MHNLDLNLDEISKIEGKASCSIKIREGKAVEVKFTIAEYKRFYTQAIRGKDAVALPQLTSRICGTCSNAHLLCTAKAVENALGLIPSEQTVKLRELLNFGLIIRDHGLHLYVFVLPDIFAKDSLLDFDENNKEQHELLHDAFEVKAAGNKLGTVVGGRSVHAPFVAVGGFSRLPDLGQLKNTVQILEKARPKAVKLAKLFFERDETLIRKNLHFCALLDEQFSFLNGKIWETNGPPVSEEQFGNHLQHVVIPYSHASGYKYKGKVYMVGALARLNLGKDKLHEKTRRELKNELGVFPSDNIHHNNLAQAVEIVHSIDSSIDIINSIKEIIPKKPQIPIRREGIGTGVIEAPRGTLYYRLEVDGTGKIKNGTIVVPTGQNQLGIEEAIKTFLTQKVISEQNRQETENSIERIVRSYDPCMSCASHFLKFKYH